MFLTYLLEDSRKRNQKVRSLGRELKIGPKDFPQVTDRGYTQEHSQAGAPNFPKSKDNFGVPGGLSPKFCIASMGHLRIQGRVEPHQPPPGFGAYVAKGLPVGLRNF